MSAEVIREFLVSLGYKVDAAGERDFVDGVRNVTAFTVALGTEMAKTAEQIAKSVSAMAGQLENLYFMSQRTKAAAQNIQAMGFAASQMGSSVEGARGSIEGLAKFLRENPGGEGLLGSIGVRTRDANGALRDTTDIMQDIGKRLKDMPQYRGIQYANVFGIDYKTLMALEQGVGKFSDRYKELLHRFGLNVQDATKKSHELMMSWRDMKASAGILSTIVATQLIDAFGELEHRWDSLDETTRRNIKTSAEWVAGIVAGWALIASGPIGIIAALAAGILLLWDDYQVWKEGGKSLIDWSKWKPGIDLALAGLHKIESALKATFGWMEKVSDKMLGGTKVGDAIGTAAAHVAAFFGSQEAQDAIDRQNWAALTPAQRAERKARWLALTPQERASTHLSAENIRLLGGDPDAKTPLGIRNNNPGNLRTGANGSFGQYKTAQDGISALGSQLRSYYNGTSRAAGYRKLQTLKDIIGTYAPSSENNTSAYVAALAQQMGVSPDAQLNLNDPGQLSALMRGIVQHENGQNPYSAEMFSKAAGASAQASAGVSIDQKITMHVSGVDKPDDVARAIGNEQSHVNDRMLRNLKGAAA